jgi:hypothetical protein
VIDHYHIYRALGWDELEAELLLDGGEHGWVGPISVGGGGVGLFGAGVEGEVVGALEAGLVDDRLSVGGGAEERGVGELVDGDGCGVEFAVVPVVQSGELAGFAFFCRSELWAAFGDD